MSESRATDVQQTHVQCTSNNRYTCVARTLNVGINIGTAQAQGPCPPSAGAQRRCSPTRRNTQACSRLSARCHSRGVRNSSGRTEANGDRRRETIRGADGRGPTERDKGKAHHSSAPAVERALSQPWCSEPKRTDGGKRRQTEVELRCHSRGVRNPSGRTEANGDRRFGTQTDGAARRGTKARCTTQARPLLSARCHSRGVRNPDGWTETDGRRRFGGPLHMRAKPGKAKPLKRARC